MATDPANSCALFITVHSHAGASRRPTLSARFQFEDHIRCVAARQCLQRNRENLRLAKMTRVAKLLHLPLPDSTPNSMPLPLPPELPDVGSFVPVSPAHQLSSPIGDLSRSGLHQALAQQAVQPPHLSTFPPFQDIEMAQLLPRASPHTPEDWSSAGLLGPQSAVTGAERSEPSSAQQLTGPPVGSALDPLTGTLDIESETESSPAQCQVAGSAPPQTTFSSNRENRSQDFT